MTCGFVQQGHADVDAPLHAAGIFLDIFLGPIGQADDLQHLVDALAQGRAAQAVHLAPEGQVFTRRHIFIQGDLLRDHAQAGFDTQRVGPDGMTHDQGVAFIRAQQAGEHRDGGGLAGAVGAKQAEDLAFFHAEIDALNSLAFAKGFVQVLYFDGFFHNYMPPYYFAIPISRKELPPSHQIRIFLVLRLKICDSVPCGLFPIEYRRAIVLSLVVYTSGDAKRNWPLGGFAAVRSDSVRSGRYESLPNGIQ